MAKFSFRLRKTAATGISGTHVDRPSSLVDVRASESGMLTLRKKSKQFFSFRRSNRDADLVVQVPQEEFADSDVPSLGKPGSRDDSAESNPDIHTESFTKPKKTPSFATVFLRRPTPSWRNERELLLDSDTQALLSALGHATPELSCVPFDLDSGTLTRTPSDARFQPYLVHELERHQSSPFAESLVGGTEAAVVHPSPSPSVKESHSDGSSSAHSAASKIHPDQSWSILPVPPIIISAPTPPHAPWSADESDYGRSLAIPPDPAQFRFSQVPTAIRTLQSAVRQLENDASFTQRKVFRLLTPFTAFIYTLGTGVMMLKKDAGVVGEPDIIKVAVLILLGMLIALALLRGVIWAMSRLGRSFCELDLEEVFTRGILVISEGERVTEADFIVGNLIT